MGELGRLIEEHQRLHGYGGKPVSDAAIARALGVSRSLMSKWKAGSGLPHPKNIDALVTLLGVSRSRVLDAALVDAGYLPKGPDHESAPIADAGTPPASRLRSGRSKRPPRSPRTAATPPTPDADQDQGQPG